MLESEFRERLGFLLLVLICFYCLVSTMILLKPILEPCLWALFLVMALKPSVELVENLLLTYVCRGLCFVCRRIRRRRSFEERDLISTESNEDDAIQQPLRSSECFQVNSAIQSFMRFFSVFFVMICFFLSTVGLGFFIHESVVYMIGNWDVYEKGVQNIIGRLTFLRLPRREPLGPSATAEIQTKLDELMNRMETRNSPSFWSSLFGSEKNNSTIDEFKSLHNILNNKNVTTTVDFDSLLSQVSLEVFNQIPIAVKNFLITIISEIHTVFFELILTLLYVFFWLLSPLRIDHLDKLLRRYMLLKTLACLGYGISVGLFLFYLKVDLAIIFGLLTFFLNYIPEVGPLVAGCLPLPLITIDSRLENPLLTMAIACVGMMFLKFIFANICEVKLIERDQKMKMNPVVILLSVAFFGFVWGPTGMLLCVPLMSVIKIWLMSDHVPVEYSKPILDMIEGAQQIQEYFVV